MLANEEEACLYRAEFQMAPLSVELPDPSEWIYVYIYICIYVCI
jgi:hypothetical protein